MSEYDPKVVLIDGDIFAYQAVFRCTREIPWGDGLWSNVADGKLAIETYLNMVNRILEDHFPEGIDVIHCFSDASGNGWRKEFYPTYKDNRGDKLPVAGLWALKQHFLESGEHDGRMHPRLEADDLMGILATDPDNPGAVIVSTDKDMLTLPAWQLNPDKDMMAHRPSVQQADFNLYCQGLSGDSTDGYPGCPKYGVKTAPRFLSGVDPEEYWLTVKEAFEKAGKDEEFARSQVLCARILRHGDWDFDKEEMTWRPE